MRRRDFLRGAGAFVVSAKLIACGDNKDGPAPGPDAAPPQNSFSFPQGVASGDPRSTSVVLWTRVEEASPSTQPIKLRVEVFTGDSADGTPVVDQDIEATFASDHCVRVLVNSLTANTAYTYRFTAGRDTIVGHTHTAPDANADVQVNLAWVSCQDYSAGHFTAYRQMITDDRERDFADRIQFVVHLGDVIYETIGETSQRPLSSTFQFISLRNGDGSPRVPPAFPQGSRDGTVTRASTLADYRHLYKTFLSDPDFQAARAKWPFIHTWDDHEFSNDSWQSMGNYTDTVDVDEPGQARKLAASQAWFEYIPVMLTGATGPAGVTQDAKDFATAMVANAPFTAPNADNFVAEPNNAAAIGAMTIYRSLRWGKHVELVMTDQRSYRSDHAIPESTVALVNSVAVSQGQPTPFFDPRNFLPINPVIKFDEGMTADGGSPPATVENIPNPRRTSPVGTMLGKAQKTWFKATIKNSDATWKLWGNEVPLMRMFIEGNTTGLGFDRILDGDAWDGYPTERNELLTFIKDQNIRNVVALTGDIHAHFAGKLMDNYDATTPVPVANELIVAGIASNSLFSFYEQATRPLPAALRALVTLGPTFIENMNLLLLFGTVSAGAFAQGQPLAVAKALTDSKNAHMLYADTNAQGYGYAKITATKIESQLVTVGRPTNLPSPGLPGVRRVANFTIPAGDPDGMTLDGIDGTPPFPFE